MPVIRKQLKSSQVYPDDIRYNAGSDTVQRNINGTWTDSPESDPRTQTMFPPRLTADPACDAAQSVGDALKGQIDSILDAIDAASTVFTIASIILSIFTFGVYAIFITLAIGIGDTMLTAGTAAISAALTAPVYHTFVCILRCHMNGSGRLNPGELTIVMSEVTAQIGGLGAEILNAMLSLAGEGGVNNLASLGTATGDCSDCGCAELCATAEQGFEYGTDLVYAFDTGTGITTITGSSVVVGGTPGVVRWGFFADSIAEGCHFFTFVVSEPTAVFYYRIVGEASSTQHGPVNHDELHTLAGPECLNLMQCNSSVAFTFSLQFFGC